MWTAIRGTGTHGEGKGDHTGRARSHPSDRCRADTTERQDVSHSGSVQALQPDLAPLRGQLMASAVFDTVRVDIVARQYVFRATGSNLKFPGFYAVWPREEDERLLPTMQVGENLDLHALKPEQHFTQPPPRFTEASLIKELEEEGIGRPSTYVPIISTIQDRG